MSGQKLDIHYTLHFILLIIKTVNEAIEQKIWKVFYFHDTSEVTTDTIRSLINYIYAVGKDKIPLAEIIQNGIEDGAQGHFAVALDHFRLGAAEGEEVPHAPGAQQHIRQQWRGNIVRYSVARQHLDHEPQKLLPGGGVAAKQEVLARQIPDHAAQAVVEQGGHMVAEAADVEQQEHDGGADNEIEDADDDVVDQGAVHHMFEFQ